MKVDAALWPVPANVEIHFYFQCMRVPQFYKTRTILDKLISRWAVPRPRGHARRDDPQPFLLGASGEQPQSACSAARVASSRWALAGSDAKRPVALSHVVKTLAATARAVPP